MRAARGSELANHRVQCGVWCGRGRALVAQPHVRLRADALLKRRDYPRLADSGVTPEGAVPPWPSPVGRARLPGAVRGCRFSSSRPMHGVSGGRVVPSPSKRLSIPGACASTCQAVTGRIEPLEHLARRDRCIGTGHRQACVWGLGGWQIVFGAAQSPAGEHARFGASPAIIASCAAPPHRRCPPTTTRAGGDSDPARRAARPLPCGQRPHRVGYAEARH